MSKTNKVSWVYQCRVRGTAGEAVYFSKLNAAIAWVRAAHAAETVSPEEFHVIIETVDSRTQQYNKCAWEVQSRCDYSVEKWIGFGCPTTVEDCPAKDKEEQVA